MLAILLALASLVAWQQSSQTAGGAPYELSGDAAAGFSLRPAPSANGADATHARAPLFEEWKPSSDANAAIDTKVAVAAAPGGLDIAWTFTNTRPTPESVPSLQLPPLALGSAIDAMNFIGSGWPQKLTPPGTDGVHRLQATYPGELYSPVGMLVTDALVVGMSLHFNVLTARHDCSISVDPVGQGVWRWSIDFSRAPQRGDGQIANPARLSGGETRTYTVSIRVTADRTRWLEVLSPYKQYFDATHGALSYTRDARAIRGCLLCLSSAQSPDNPAGWVPEAGRPDRNGYSQVTALLQGALGQADRAILWTPTGLAWQQKSLNYPFQFTTHWRDDPNSPMASAPQLLRSVPRMPSQSWGLWWGHSADYNPAWDTLPMTPLDPTQPSQRAAAFGELDLAVEAGASTVGLDAFSHASVPVWVLVPWLEELQSRAPSVRFCTEGRAPDVLHRIAPTWQDMWRFAPDRQGELRMIRGPFILADWLLPGHETWAAMLFDRSNDQRLHGAADAAAQRASIQWAASVGFVPVVFSSTDVRGIEASSGGLP